MKTYIEQIQRIKDKLLEAKNIDKNLNVFGANMHKYIINEPTTYKKVSELEQKFSIELPICYKSFILEIGNGGISFRNSAAGPDYGIYPLGIGIDELIVEDTEKYLKNDCIITPDLTDEYWGELTKPIQRLESISNEKEYIECEGKVFSGILPISSKGCSYLSGIVLNGDYKGRILNLDYDLQKPFFSLEANFLDWYENWIDKVITCELIPRDKESNV